MPPDLRMNSGSKPAPKLVKACTFSPLNDLHLLVTCVCVRVCVKNLLQTRDRPQKVVQLQLQAKLILSNGTGDYIYVLLAIWKNHRRAPQKSTKFSDFNLTKCGKVQGPEKCLSITLICP